MSSLSLFVGVARHYYRARTRVAVAADGTLAHVGVHWKLQYGYPLWPNESTYLLLGILVEIDHI
jgi:hypothetical protein